MAEDTSNQTKSGSKYAIDFLKEGKVEFTLTLGEKNDKYGELTEVSFHKEIYQPGCVEFKVQVGTKTQASCKGSVDLKYGVDIVAKNYYIFEKVTKGEYVTYKAYSVDKFLTIDKFNQSFTAKKLVAGMISQVLATPKSTAFQLFVANIAKKDGASYSSNLNHLVYQKTINKDEEESCEYIIPYSVQYNESFYDFLVRMCNRYGEFLYCENNEFHVGLQTGSESIITIGGADINDKIKSIERYESCVNFNTGPKLKVPNYLRDEKIGLADLVESEGVVAEDYFEPIENKEYALLSDYTPPVATFFDLLSSLGSAQTLSQGLAALDIKSALTFGIANYFKSDINDKYENLFFSEKLLTAENHEGDKKNEYSVYGKHIDNEWYWNILNNEKKTEKGKAVVKYDNYHHFLLGDKVVLKDINTVESKAYIVYNVSGGNDGASENMEITLIPLLDDKVYPLPKQDLHIRKASPQRAKVISNFDPERLGRVLVKYPWQYMFTGEENLFEGQENKENAALILNMQTSTPWIRVAYPMASDAAGFMFFPSVGDEVLIDYEDGNVERPFVKGSFYTATNRPSVPSSTHTVGITKSITSHNGHHISFTDTPGDLRFLANMLPGWSFASKFGWGLDAPIEGSPADKYGKYMSGGFEIGDYLGVYKITGSTHNRNITISSPVGDVVIDAFSGITLNAPSGNINIVGKNVNIEARNNLTMTSGTNILNPYRSNGKLGLLKDIGKSFIALGVGTLKNVLGLDLSFHRTWLEVLIRPIGGTMLIKSYRFMRLEAGDGVTQLPKRNVVEVDKESGFIYLKRGYFDTDGGMAAILEELRDIVQKVKSAFTWAEELLRIIKEVEISVKNFRSLSPVDLGFYDIIKKCGSLVKDDYIDLTKVENGLLNKYADVYIYYNECLSNMDVSVQHFNRLCNDFLELKHSETWKKELWPSLEKCADNLDKWLENCGEGTLQYIPINLNEEIKRKCLFEEIKYYIKNHKKLKDIVEIDDDFNDFDINEVIKVKLAIENVMEQKENKILTIANGITGLEGMLDDNVWGIKDKGSILISSNKNRYFNLANDGTFKQGDFAINVVEKIREMIRTMK